MEVPTTICDITQQFDGLKVDTPSIFEVEIHTFKTSTLLHAHYISLINDCMNGFQYQFMKKWIDSTTISCVLEVTEDCECT